MPETTDIPLPSASTSFYFLWGLPLFPALEHDFFKCYFLCFFFYLLLIYLKLVGCLPSACFLIWSPGLDCSREENFSSLKLSIKMRHFLSPSPRPHFGPFGSLSLPALLYLVLVLVLSPHLPPSTKESSILWSYFALFLLTLEATNTCKIYFCRCMFHMCAILYMIIKLIICHSSALAGCSLTCTLLTVRISYAVSMFLFRE